MLPVLTPAERELLVATRRATLATIAPDGAPRLVPVCFVVIGDVVWSPLDEKPKAVDDVRSLARVRDIRERPAVALLVDRWSEDWDRLAWLRLDCSGELLEPEPREREEHAAAIAALRAKYRQYEGHRLEERPVIRFTVHRAVSWGSLRG